jgi:pentatricopeptide repeat protein
MEHYGCVVDLLGRAGRLDEAMHVVETMPIRPNEVVLGALLAGCRMHGDLDMVKQLMQHLFELDPGATSTTCCFPTSTWPSESGTVWGRSKA